MPFIRIFMAAAIGAAVAIPAAAGAQKPDKPGGSNTVTIAAAPTTITFTRSTVVSGDIKGPDAGGSTVNLEEDGFPYDGFKRVASKVTDSAGKYSFAVTPKLNTKYRVEARTKPPVSSPEVLVQVRPRITLRLSDRTPRRGQRVRFSGLVTPAHDGRIVLIQRRTSTGSYRTVARTRAGDTGTDASRFVRRITIRRSGVYRARTLRHDDHATGTSPRRTARVG